MLLCPSSFLFICFLFIFIDFEDDKETYSNFLLACEILEKLFDRLKVDIVTLKGLSPFIGQQILKEVEYV